MRGITMAALFLGVASTALAAPKASTKKPAAHKMTAKECSIACTKAMHAKGMSGSCPASMCASGACPMMSKSTHPSIKGHGKTAKPTKKG